MRGYYIKNCKQMERYVVIMAGGAGERFWPLSRKSKPKHLWNVVGGDACLLSMTYSRARETVGGENIFVVTNPEQIEAITLACPEIARDKILVEPAGRDTTAAIGFSAAYLKRISGGSDCSFAVLPSDHVVKDVRAFSETLGEAFRLAESGDKLVTIGITPTFPATGYGYIRKGEKFGGGEYYKVSRFFEKPNLERATEYLNSGEFFWNAGIFVWKTSSILSAIDKNLKGAGDILRRIESAPDFNKTASELYPQIEKISIDFSVMERADNAWTVPAKFDWDDVGSWTAVERHCPKDADGNTVIGELYAKDSKNCLVFDAAGRATALLGVEDIIVVHSPDATLVCKKQCAQNLKELVKILPDKLRR